MLLVKWKWPAHGASPQVWASYMFQEMRPFPAGSSGAQEVAALPLACRLQLSRMPQDAPGLPASPAPSPAEALTRAAARQDPRKQTDRSGLCSRERLLHPR